MKDLILTPPVAFLIILSAVTLISYLLSFLSSKPKSDDAALDKSYACGEEVLDQRVQPDYAAFFPFAFFFTILHVVALMITTVPIQTAQSLAIALIYIVGAITALFILFRRV